MLRPPPCFVRSVVAAADRRGRLALLSARRARFPVAASSPRHRFPRRLLSDLLPTWFCVRAWLQLAQRNEGPSRTWRQINTALAPEGLPLELSHRLSSPRKKLPPVIPNPPHFGGVRDLLFPAFTAPPLLSSRRILAV